MAWGARSGNLSWRLPHVYWQDPGYSMDGLSAWDALRPPGLLRDQPVVLSGSYPHKQEPLPRRRARLKALDAPKTLIFLTNLFGPAPTTICALTKTRWQLELFFTWVRPLVS